MKNIYFFLLILSCSANAQNYSWGKGMGGTMSDKANAIVVDDSGNVYITGKFSGTADFDPSPNVANLVSAGQGDIFVAKYTKLGVYQWAFRLGNVIDDEGNSITIDSNGDLLLTGSFQGPVDFDPSANTATITPAAYNDIFIAKYTRNGIYKWAKDIYGAGYDYGYCIASGHSNKVYVCGRYNKTADFDPSANTANLTSANNTVDIFLACYDSSGNFSWAKSIGSTSTELANSFKLDKDDNIYLCGYYADSTNLDPSGYLRFTSKGINDFFIAKYDSLGTLKWGKSIGAKGDDYATALAIDNASNVYVAGRFSDTLDFNPGAGSDIVSSLGSTDGFITAYDVTGNYKWVRAIGNAYYDNSVYVAANQNGSIYVTGSYIGTIDFDPLLTHTSLTSKAEDVYFCKYDSTGKFSWVKGIGETNAQAPRFLYLDATNNIYLAGSFYTSIVFEGTTINAAGQDDIFLVKYSDPVVITTTETQLEKSPQVQVYPNPSSGIFTVSTSSMQHQAIQVSVYNTLGALCAEQRAATNTPLQIDISTLPAGLYLLKWQQGQQCVTRHICKN